MSDFVTPYGEKLFRDVNRKIRQMMVAGETLFGGMPVYLSPTIPGGVVLVSNPKDDVVVATLMAMDAMKEKEKLAVSERQDYERRIAKLEAELEYKTEEALQLEASTVVRLEVEKEQRKLVRKMLNSLYRKLEEAEGQVAILNARSKAQERKQDKRYQDLKKGFDEHRVYANKIQRELEETRKLPVLTVIDATALREMSKFTMIGVNSEVKTAFISLMKRLKRFYPELWANVKETKIEAESSGITYPTSPAIQRLIYNDPDVEYTKGDRGHPEAESTERQGQLPGF